MPLIDSDSFIKINCDWWGTRNRLFPTTKQIINDSLFSVTDYCWVYFGVRMFGIGVVIVMLSGSGLNVRSYQESYHEPQYVVSFSTYVSLILQSYFRLFLLHGHLKVMRAMNIWNRSIGGYIQECTVLCVKSLDSLCKISIFRGHFFSLKWHLILTTKTARTDGKLGVSGGGGGWWCVGLGVKLFLITFLSVLFPIPR